MFANLRRTQSNKRTKANDHDIECSPDKKATEKEANKISSFKAKAKITVQEVARPRHSIFQDWTSDALREILVENNVQVRGAGLASHETLVRICDEAFGSEVNYEEKDVRSRLYTLEDLTRMNNAARRIQKAYINRKRFLSNPINSHIPEREDALSTIPWGYDDVPNHEIISNCKIDAYEHTENDENIYEREKLNMPEAPPSDSDNSVLSSSEACYFDEEIEVEWRRPSWKYAKKYEAANRPHRSGKDMKTYDWRRDTLGRHCTVGGCGEQLDLWDEGKTSEFSQFGSGITNYFKFLKWCCWVMGILSIMYLPAIIINMFGASVQYESNSAALTTLGNLGSAKDVEFIQIPGCDSNKYHFETCAIKKDDLALFYALLDAAGTIFVIIAWVWLRTFEKREVDHLNRSTVNASDYTLRVKSIPENATERELAIHFADVTGEAIAEVNLAFKNSKEIELYFKRGRLMRERTECIQRIRYLKTVGKNRENKTSVINKRLRNLLRDRERLTALIQLRDEERDAKVDRNPKAIQAFVTFQTEEGFVKAMSAYHLGWIRTICCFYPRRLRFKGRRIKVSQAPEPSTIMWENIEVSERSRTLRKCLTTSIATLAIFLSVVFTFWARDFKIQTLKSTEKQCPRGFEDLTGSDQYEIIQKDTALSHCYCLGLSLQNQWQESLCRDYVESKLKSNLMSYSAGIFVCVMNVFFTLLMDRAGSFEKHQSLDTMEGSNMARVFFLKFVNTGCLVLLYNQKWIQRLVGVRLQDPYNFNVEWYETGGVGIIIVMMINIFSPHIGPIVQHYKHMSKIQKIEKHLTDDKETDDNFRIWYTQEELNAEFIGPHFRLNYRYTQLLINFYISWMYAIGMPILPLIGALSFYASYWVDKYLFCNFYRIPPKYSDKIGRTSTKLIGLGIVLHLIMSSWILGNQQIFVGESIIGNNKGSQLNNLAGNNNYNGNVPMRQILLKKHVFPLVVLALAFVFGQIFKRFLSGSLSSLTRCLRCLVCMGGNEIYKLKSMMNTVSVEYSNARARGIIKGLASYNILQNSKYQEAFAISSEFAMTHNRLSSIRGYNINGGDLCLADDQSSQYSDNS